jgi:hypothetical protein
VAGDFPRSTGPNRIGMTDYPLSFAIPFHVLRMIQTDTALSYSMPNQQRLSMNTSGRMTWLSG